jgi:hypothetical protein
MPSKYCVSLTPTPIRVPTAVPTRGPLISGCTYADNTFGTYAVCCNNVVVPIGCGYFNLNNPIIYIPPNPPTFPPCATRSRGDANCNGTTDVSDFLLFRQALNGQALTCANCSADFNADGKVNVSDYELWRSVFYPSTVPLVTLPISTPVMTPPAHLSPLPPEPFPTVPTPMYHQEVTPTPCVSVPGVFTCPTAAPCVDIPGGPICGGG